MISKSLFFLLCVCLIYAPCEANPLSRIVNGEKAQNYQFPWHVNLQITSSQRTTMTYCGGSLIADMYVLTAASCLENAVSIQVDIGSIEFLRPYETQTTYQYLIHPQYDEISKFNNIAVIRLPSSVTFRINVRAILLPRLSESAESFDSIESYVCGFGVTEPGSNYLSNDLKFAQKTVIPNDECRAKLDPQFVEASVMCAIGFNGTTQSVCYGDQGGALVSHIDGSWVQIGVSSMVNPSGCGVDAPAVFTRVAPYLGWIESLTGIVLRP